MRKGLSAVIYTQTTDVETENQCLLTYDRKVDKMGLKMLQRQIPGITPPVLDRTILVFTDEFPVGPPAVMIIMQKSSIHSMGQSLIIIHWSYSKPFSVTDAGVIKALHYMATKRAGQCITN